MFQESESILSDCSILQPIPLSITPIIAQTQSCNLEYITRDHQYARLAEAQEPVKWKRGRRRFHATQQKEKCGRPRHYTEEQNQELLRKTDYETTLHKNSPQITVSIDILNRLNEWKIRLRVDTINEVLFIFLNR